MATPDHRSTLTSIERFLVDCRGRSVDQQALSCAEDAIADLKAAVAVIEDDLQRTAPAPWPAPAEPAIDLAAHDGRVWDVLTVRQRVAYRLVARCIERAFVRHGAQVVA